MQGGAHQGEAGVATIVTVHGTYAHIVGPPDAPAPAELQWWQAGSACEQELRQLVGAQDGELTFVPFRWSGENSERERRKAGAELFALLRDLESRNETYCIVGHSHGGSVIAAALLESVARKVPLNGLKRWITVGTPFVALKKERFLFSRLTLARKVVLVASMMLLLMFVVFLGGQLIDGSLFGRRDGQWLRLAFSAAMMSAPFLIFYIVLKILDARSHLLYRPKLLEKAEELYAERWLALNHDDDEAVQGLRLLPRLKMNFFDRGFAVPFLTLAAIFVLPLAYLVIVTSPTAMVAIADVLKTRLYDVGEYPQADAALEASRQQMRDLRARIRAARQTAEKSTLDPTAAESARQQIVALRKQITQVRSNLLKVYPDLPEMQRAQRFERRFFKRNGQPCEGGKLCGGGRDFGVNSELLFHIVTDELASAFVDEDTRWGPFGGLFRLWLPIVLVPIIFALIALAVLIAIQALAGILSAFLSGRLDRLTHKEITRSALGNDTIGEVTLGAEPHPSWISKRYPFLPPEVAGKISDYSNEISFSSLAKFRNAISTLAFSVDEEGQQGILATYLTWRELIHTAYFEVEEFRRLLAFAIGEADGFTASEAFASAPEFERTRIWHGTLQLAPPPP